MLSRIFFILILIIDVCVCAIELLCALKYLNDNDCKESSPITFLIWDSIISLGMMYIGMKIPSIDKQYVCCLFPFLILYLVWLIRGAVVYIHDGFKCSPSIILYVLWSSIIFHLIEMLITFIDGLRKKIHETDI